MTESFAKLFEKSIKENKIRTGSIIKGTIISIRKNIVLIDAKLKSESAIPINQFYNTQGELEISVGDKIDVSLEAIEDGLGETLLSREKAKRYKSWLILEKAHKEDTNIIGIINGKVKGGFTVETNGIRAFLPGSLVDIRPVRDTIHLENKDLEFKVIKLDKKRNNVVVSRRAVIEYDSNNERNKLLEKLQEGMEIQGVVKNLTDYGAFIDLGGVDGLLHITDMAWKRVKHPSEIVNISDVINVKIIKFDRERVRVSLGLKQLGKDPWTKIKKRYPEGIKLNGRVTNLTDYGCFVEIEEGIEGLVHISEMDWTNKNIHPSKLVKIGDIVKVIILDIDEERRRISLGLKQCKINPWKKFAKKHKKGDKITGKIKSITDFGIFIGLNEGIDGLIHLSDLSWNKNVKKTLRKYKKGDKIKAVVLQIDPKRERVSLGIKQITVDPFRRYISKNRQGTIVKGLIKKIDVGGVKIQLSNYVEGYLRYYKKKYNFKEKYKNKFKIGQIIGTKFINVDRKKRIINLSIKITKKKKIFKKKRNIFYKKKNRKRFNNLAKKTFKKLAKKKYFK